jgi:hypothetical protein
MKAQNGGWRLKMGQWRCSSVVVADLHHFDEEQDPDLEPHQRKKVGSGSASQ